MAHAQHEDGHSDDKGKGTLWQGSALAVTEELLPRDLVLSEHFTQIERVYAPDPRLLKAVDSNGKVCFLISDSAELHYVARFDSEQERDDWFTEVCVSAWRKKHGSPDDEDGGAAPVPATTAVRPRTPAGSAARTILEAAAPPRDP